MFTRDHVVIVALLVGIQPGIAAAQAQPAATRSGQTDKTPGTLEPGPPPKAARDAEPAERLSTTSHAVRIGNVEVKYTATAGMLRLDDEQGTPKAQAFFVAYTRDDQPVAMRPITFAYNGGPGSASIWLHMGTLGPRRVEMADDGFQPAPPFRLVNNEFSLLDVTDIVMIDPVMTGYSRPVEGEDKRQFHGVSEDLQWVAEFIRRYTTRFERWQSPKYLLGESYGTFRSAGLSAVLQQRHGLELNGIVLVSMVLDFSTIRFYEGNDLPYITFLPTYTATAWYHKKLVPDLQADLRAALDQARAFAIGEYATALLKGSRLSAAERTAMAQKVARFTGLSAEYVEQANLRIEAGRFRKALLRDQRLITGRLDSRFTAMDADAAGERQEFDPSNTALQGAYTAMFLDYVRRDLQFESDLPYYTSGQVRPWNYGDFEGRPATMVDRLRGAMARNPTLRVFVANGYYDMATPFFGTEYTMDRLGWEPEYAARVTMGYYEGGHMMYIRIPSLKQFKEDVARFITGSLQAPAPTAGTVH